MKHCKKMKFFSSANVTADLVTFTDEILNRKLHFLCIEMSYLLDQDQAV